MMREGVLLESMSRSSKGESIAAFGPGRSQASTHLLSW